MGAYDEASDSEAFAHLRAAHARMGGLLEQESVNLIELAKAYQAISIAMAEVARSTGRPSVRFDAVERALDLRTPKSALHAFVEG